MNSKSALVGLQNLQTAELRTNFFAEKVVLDNELTNWAIDCFLGASSLKAIQLTRFSFTDIKINSYDLLPRT